MGKVIGFLFLVLLAVVAITAVVGLIEDYPWLLLIPVAIAGGVGGYWSFSPKRRQLRQQGEQVQQRMRIGRLEAEAEVPVPMDETRCRNCKRRLVVGAEWCSYCGMAVHKAVHHKAVLCSKCGTRLPRGGKFCPACGTDVVPTRAKAGRILLSPPPDDDDEDDEAPETSAEPSPAEETPPTPRHRQPTSPAKASSARRSGSA